MHLVDGVSIREIRRRAGLPRETVTAPWSPSAPPVYRREKTPSKLDFFQEEMSTSCARTTA
jgi:hypothetical protein